MSTDKPRVPPVDGRPVTSDLELVWRCLRCGEQWPNDGGLLPDTCPGCRAPKTDFELIRED